MKMGILLGLLLAAFSLQGAEKDDGQTFLTPETAGRDFADQGEYSNDWGGAHIIALGDDKFRLIIYKGGLPGAGWDKEFRRELEGKRADDKIVFTPGDDQFTHELVGGVIKTKTPDGQEYTMQKVNRQSPTLGKKPPAGAVVLFDGKGVDQWADGHVDDRNLLAAGTRSKRSFTNFTVHAEFLLPFKPKGRGQGRGNSGLYLQDRYELQILDSFGLQGLDNECGGIYSQAKPSENMCYPPLTWQTYDIDFETAKFDESGAKIKNAVATIRHNGVVIHDKLEFKRPTGGGKKETPEGGVLQLQGHGNPVFFRNIWVVER